MGLVKCLVAVLQQRRKARAVRHIMPVNQPVGGGVARRDAAARIQKRRAAHGVVAVKAAAQIVFVVAGGLHHRQVDARALHTQPADQVGVLLVQFAVGGQDITAGGHVLRSLGRGVRGGIGLSCFRQRIAGGCQRCHRHGTRRGQGRGGRRIRGRGGHTVVEQGLAHRQHGGCRQGGGTHHLQQPGTAALFAAQRRARRKGIVRTVAPQLAVTLRHGSLLSVKTKKRPLGRLKNQIRRSIRSPAEQMQISPAAPSR